MASPFGYTFAPGSGQNVPMEGQQPFAGSRGPQEAVRLLNLHLPKRQSPTAVAPNSLLTGAGGGGLQGQGLGGLDTVLQHLMQAFSAPAQPAPAIPSRPGPMPTSPPVNIGGGPSMPQGAQPPEFVGQIDTPPLQNAPSLFGGGGVEDSADPQNWMTNASYGPPKANDPFWWNFGLGGAGGSADPFDPFWWQFVQDQMRDSMRQQQSAPSRNTPPPAHVIVENPLGGGGSLA